MEINKELMQASIIGLRDAMGLKPEETLLVVTDEVKRDIGLALHEAGKQLCKESILVEMKSREINGEEPPFAISEMMKMVDVVVIPTAKSLTHTDARRNAVKEGVRVGTMPGISVEIMSRCLNADFDKIVELTEYVAKRLEGVKTVKVVTEAGTNLVMPIEGRMIIPSTGVLREKGQSGNMPSGETYLAPIEGKSNGTLVIDGSMAGIGVIKTPIKVEIRDGYAEEITGGEEAQRLIAMLDKNGREARAVAEFGIGTNYKAILSGQILEDEKVLGTIHVAFGNNLTMGGSIAVNSHLDGLVKSPDVYFDDELVMKKGKLLGIEV
ncbi:MAG: aminopeptidase [Bacteroidota bacterium]|jgi:aminopeptidase|nr:aminopeptidase [Bacteroidales bacterium]MDI9535047.1 aminopeptidase [Bacteroidota bacterium]OQC44723.1 MAG: 2,5-dihydroxypyridine 5,6-dioxygenase [Bacteroidetes bacterium ADurb.Bin028]NLP19888.1 aminopeptidase [Bacteroidales bacterium]HNY45152.1 aminopeptidase [Bacteroidales bacterium]